MGENRNHIGKKLEGDGGPHRPLWPVVIGGVSIILAAEKLLELPTWVARVSLMPAGAGVPRIYAFASEVPLAAVLLLGGVLLVQRRRVGVSLHLLYAVLQLSARIMARFVFHRVIPPDVLTPQGILAAYDFVAGAIIYWMGYSLFLLGWFLQPRVWRQVRGWGVGQTGCSASQAPVVPLGRRPTWVTIIGTIGIVLAVKQLLPLPLDLWGYFDVSLKPDLRMLLPILARLLVMVLLAAGILMLRMRRLVFITGIAFGALELPVLMCYGIDDLFQHLVLDVKVHPWQTLFTQFYWHQFVTFFLPLLAYTLFFPLWLLRGKVREEIGTWR